MTSIKNGKNFLSSCHLCLQEVARRQQDPVIRLDDEDEEDKTCYKNNLHKQSCLRTIYKLIKLDPGKVFSERLSAVSNNRVHHTDLTVSLCEKCLKVTKRLSSLCLQLEAMQMKVNHVLEEFLNILQNSRKGPMDQVARLQEKVTTSLDLLHVPLSYKMRQETEKKCREHLQKFAVPRVDLSKAKTELINRKATRACMPPVRSRIRKKIVIKSSTGRVSLGDQLSEETETKCKAKSRKNLKDSTVCEVEAVISDHDGPLSDCDIIGSTGDDTTTTPPTPTKTNDSPCPSSVPPLLSVTEKMLTDACIKCYLCNAPFGIWESLRVHLKRVHPDASRVKPKVLNHIHAHVCNMCGIKLSSKILWTRHIMFYCCFRRGYTKSCSNDDIVSCNICPSGKFASEELLKTHIFTTHPEHVLLPIKDSDCSPSQFRDICLQMINVELFSQQNQKGDGLNFVCGYCSASFSAKTSFHTHYLQLHFNKFSTKVSRLQRDILLNSPPPPTLTKQESESHSKIEIKPDRRKAEKFKCQDCGALFKLSGSLTRHRRKEHNLVAPADWCEDSSEQLPSSDHAVPPTTKNQEKTKRNPSGRFKCSRCKAVFFRETSLRMHVTTFHLNHMLPTVTTRSSSRVNKIAPNRSGRRENKRKQKKRKPNGFECHHCGDILKHKSSLDSHIRMKHFLGKVEKPPRRYRYLHYYCQYCKRGFSTLGHRNGHLKRSEHCRELAFGIGRVYFEPVPCEFCGKVLPSSESLKKHQTGFCPKIHTVTEVLADQSNTQVSNREGDEEIERVMDMDLAEQSGGPLINAKIDTSGCVTLVDVDEDERGMLRVENGKEDVDVSNIFLDTTLKEDHHEQQDDDNGQHCLMMEMENPEEMLPLSNPEPIEIISQIY